MATNYNYSNWDFRNGYVDPNNMKGGSAVRTGDFISSESILIAVGSPFLSDTNITQVYSVGVIQNFNLAQNKNIQQLFEIGSRDTILLPGRTFIQATIARILYNGPSIMKAAYAYNEGMTGDTQATPVGGALPTIPQSQAPGDGNLYLNLAATMFNNPIGIALLVHDMENDVYGGAYMENCHISSHNLSLASGQTVVAENIALRIGKVRPISLNAPASKPAAAPTPGT